MFRHRRVIPSLSASAVLVLFLGMSTPAYADPGDLDPSFGTGGTVSTDLAGNDDQVQALVLQGNGRIVVAGCTNCYSLSATDFALARYKLDGTLDLSFGGGGTVTTDFAGFSDYAYALAQQGNGKIVAAGCTTCNGPGNGDFALARYNSDGTLDGSFGSGGEVTTDFAGLDDQAQALAVQGNGKILAAGYTGGLFALARYNSDGTLDQSFGNGGKVRGPIGIAYALALQGDGKIVAAGIAASFNDFGLVRYNQDGTLDRSFGNRGRVKTDFAGFSDQAYALALQGNGKIVAAGKAGTNGRDDFALARYNLDGTLDGSFGSGGKVTTDFTGGYDNARAVAFQWNGKIVAAGYTILDPYAGEDYDFALVRYNRNGTLDPSFGAGGRVTTDFANDLDQAQAMALQWNGKIVAAGRSYAGVTDDFALARYL